MPTNKLIISPSTCTNFNGVIYKICLPNVDLCEIQDVNGLITNCDNVYNCNRCQTDGKYYVPILEGDTLMLQTQFKGSKASPSAGAFTASLVTDSGVNTNEGSFITKTAHYGCGITYQLWTVNLSAIVETCFKIVFSDGVNEYCSQEFRKEKCIDTVTVESTHDGKDCMNNCYENGYSNKIRLHGKLLRLGTVNSYDGKRAVIRETYSLRLTKRVPEFMLNYLSKSIFGVDKTDDYASVKINGETYFFEDLNVTNKVFSNTFLLEFEVFKECKDNSGACK